jgi:mRNA-degrading endonuclease RelE of RelBE toxin-antitoxin system
LKRIRFSDDAKADIRAIPQHIAMNILTAIHRLAEHGSGNVKKLQGSDPPEFRLRVGDHRVRFTEDDADTLNIHAVKDRKDAYR